MDTLYKTQNDLQKGRECLERMVKSLEQEKVSIKKKNKKKYFNNPLFLYPVDWALNAPTVSSSDG